jgi:Cu/Ag efflux protein CusF
MLRKFVGALFALVVLAGGLLLAAEITGKVKKVDLDKNTITVTVNDKDQEFSLTDDSKVLNAKGKAVKDREKSLKGLKEGAEVTVTSEKKSGKDVITELKLPAAKKNQ